MSEEKTIVDLCNKRIRLYQDLLLGRVSFIDYSKKMDASLLTAEKEIKKVEKKQAKKV